MPDPRISVVMPVYNAERYVAEAVESILSQSFEDFEFLVFDDGSTDRSFAILEAYAERDRRIHLFSTRHKGYVPWLNEGIARARGEFIARMDADDVSLPDRFARQLAYLQANPSCSVVGCSTLWIDPDGSPLGKCHYESDPAKLDLLQLAGEGTVIAHSASMMRRSSVVSAGGYRERYETMEDYDLWLRLAEYGSLGNLREVLLKYRQHHDSVNAMHGERQIRLADELVNEARLRRGLDRLPLSMHFAHAQVRSSAERHLAWAMAALASRHRRTAFKHSLIAIRQAPAFARAWAVFLCCFVPRGILSLMKRSGGSRSLTRWNRRPERDVANRTG